MAINRKSVVKRHRRAVRSPVREQKSQRRLQLLGTASVSMFTVVILLMFGASSAVPQYAMRTPQVASVVHSVLVDLANRDRESKKLPPLKINPVLTAAAQAKADDMAARGYFAHVAPDGKEPWYWFEKVGYQYEYAGENLAIDFADSIDVQRAWMNSPTHRDNILNGRFTEVGIATAQGMYQGRLTTFVVQEFGTPKGTFTTIVPTSIPSDPLKPAVTSASKKPTAQVTNPKAPTSNVLGTADAARSEVAQNATKEMIEDREPTVVSAASISVEPNTPPVWAYAVSAPHTVLTYVYYLLMILVIAALAYVTGFEMRQHHVRHAVRAGFLIGLMGVLLVAAHFIVFSEPVLAAIK